MSMLLDFFEEAEYARKMDKAIDESLKKPLPIEPKEEKKEETNGCDNKEA